MPHIYLIGMPGAGKTTLGRMAAASLGMAFTDLDGLVVQQSGMTISDIFRQEGETGFRKRELAALASIAPAPVQLIACGGGTATCPESANYLLNHGRCIWIQRDLSAIQASIAEGSRPLLAGKGMQGLIDLAAARTPLYQSLAAAVLRNEGALHLSAASLTDLIRPWLPAAKPAAPGENKPNPSS